MPTQLNGRCCNMDEIMSVAKENNIMVFEDSAQGLGASYKGKKAGTFGSFGTISFYPAKVLGCFGDGGAVMTNDDQIANKLSLLRDHGRDINGEVVAWGTNSRLDNLQAAFLKFRLSNYSQDIERRREIAELYYKGLKELKTLHLPPSPSDKNHFDVYQNFEITTEKETNFKSS